MVPPVSCRISVVESAPDESYTKYYDPSIPILPTPSPAGPEASAGCPSQEGSSEGGATMISDAECDYDEWNKAGEIKRSQVIKKIYEMYPILSKVVNQEELTKWIDAEIDDSLETLNDIVNGIGE